MKEERQQSWPGSERGSVFEGQEQPSLVAGTGWGREKDAHASWFCLVPFLIFLTPTSLHSGSQARAE